MLFALIVPIFSSSQPAVEAHRVTMLPIMDQQCLLCVESQNLAMVNTRIALGVGLAAATLGVCIVNAIGNIAIILKAGPTPVLSLAAMALAGASFAVTLYQRSLVVAGLLAASGVVFTIPALSAMGYSFATIVFPGPILGVIFGLVILGLGMAMVVRARKVNLVKVGEK